MWCRCIGRGVGSNPFGARSVGSCANAVKKQNGVKPFDEIPGPKALPVIGNLWRYLPLVGEYSFERLHKTYDQMLQQYGWLVKEKVMGDRTLVHVFHPVDMQEVYRNEGRKPHRISHRAMEKYRRERPHVYKSVGLFPSNGEEWYRFRHLFQKILMTPATANACTTILEDITNDLVDRIPTLLDDRGELDLQPELFNWALECIGAITLNRRLGCLSSDGSSEAKRLVHAANVTHQTIFETENNPLIKYIHTKSYVQLETAQDFLASCVERYLREAEDQISKRSDTETLLAKMLQVEDADHKDIFTMILDMFLAGIDTTSFTTAFALYNLTRNQIVQDQLRDELVSRLPSKHNRIDRLQDRIPYLEWVIKETLRLNPVAVGTGRVIPCDLSLSGYHVPAGTMVILQHQVASKHPEFFKDPEAFLPERWANRNCGGLASSPFGYGPRLCVGMRLAKKEIYLALAKLIRNFEFSYHYDDIDSVNRLINVPDKPLRLRVRRVER